jgi:hypothetical protein
MDRGLPRSEALAQSYVAGGRLDHHEMSCVNIRSLGARDLARLDRAMTPTSPKPELPDPELEDEIGLNPGDPTNRQAKRARAKVRRRNRKRVRE